MKTAMILLMTTVSILAHDAPKIEWQAGKCQGGLRPSRQCTTCETCWYCGKQGKWGKRPENSATCAVCKPKDKRR